MEKKINILYVDDESNNLVAFKALFRREYNIHTAVSADEGKALMKEHVFHVILTDQRMPGTTGVEFLESILAEYPDPIRMLITGYADIQAVIQAINKGQVYRYITKPWDEQELRISIENAFEVYTLRESNKHLTDMLLEANKQLDFMLRQKLLS
ncbi:MAG TPA: response regulator [Bacteroidia bacterium]|jgi:response regulator RpfG family c-di-GMP phosphodiesterase|nr:response regulator [Bacteroidia bacterium]